MIDRADGAEYERRIEQAFALDMGIFKIKFMMNFLMNLCNHLHRVSALLIGGWWVYTDYFEIGVVVAFFPGSGGSTIRGAISSIIFATSTSLKSNTGYWPMPSSAWPARRAQPVARNNSSKGAQGRNRSMRDGAVNEISAATRFESQQSQPRRDEY